MKYLIHIVIFTIVFNNSNKLLGQNNDTNKFSLQLNLGASRTLHHNKPLSLLRCFEGCIADEQKPKIAPNGNINIYGIFNENNSLKIGFGVNVYRYLERGRSNDGNGISSSPYEIIEWWDFYNISLGYRYIFNSSKKIKLFLENDFVYEIPIQDYGILKNGLAIQPTIGMITNISNKWSLIAQGFYRSGISNYGDRGFGKNYVPYAFGLQLGFNLKI